MSVDGHTQLALPLIGANQSLSSGVQGEIERQIIEIEQVAPRDFFLSAMPALKFAGGLRSALAPIKELFLEEICKDNVNRSRSKIGLDFTLLKGSYATIVLREFMKTPNPIEAGF